jgi:restriction system protein
MHVLIIIVAMILLMIGWSLGAPALFVIGLLALGLLIRHLASSGRAIAMAETEKAFAAITTPHAEVLARKREMLTTRDDYGNTDDTRWKAELAYFHRSVVLRDLPAHLGSKLALAQSLDLAGETAFTDWFAAHDPLAAVTSRLSDARPHPDITPIEYEHWCSNALVRNGWTARATQASGDQGADVLAEKDGLRLVIQCKLYSQPVGNKAVQEAMAARQFYACDIAAVVSNQPYTRSARDLARTGNVALLHDSQLADFDFAELCSGLRATPAAPGPQSARPPSTRGGDPAHDLAQVLRSPRRGPVLGRH